MSLTSEQWERICEYVEEIDSVIDADDGTLVPMPLLDKHELIKELIHEVESK